MQELALLSMGTQPWAGSGGRSRAHGAMASCPSGVFSSPPGRCWESQLPTQGVCQSLCSAEASWGGQCWRGPHMVQPLASAADALLQGPLWHQGVPKYQAGNCKAQWAAEGLNAPHVTSVSSPKNRAKALECCVCENAEGQPFGLRGGTGCRVNPRMLVGLLLRRTLTWQTPAVVFSVLSHTF